MATRPPTALPYLLLDTKGPASLAFVECEIDHTRLSQTRVSGLLGDMNTNTAELLRCAVSEVGAGYPKGQVLVSVRQSKREGGIPAGYDLPAALAVLSAFDIIPPPIALPIIGAAELDPKGNLRHIRGAVSIARLAATLPTFTFILPPSTQLPAEYISPNLRTARHLREIVDALRSPAGVTSLPALNPTPRRKPDPVDPTPVNAAAFDGALAAIRAGDPVLLLAHGPGSGKMLLTRQIAAALGPVPDDRRLENDTLSATAGIDLPGGLPYRAPHHMTPTTGLIGKLLSAAPGIGECSLAHGGLLVLDDAPEFGSDALSSVARAFRHGEVYHKDPMGPERYTPARFALVMTATIPGEFDEEERERYLNRARRYFPTLRTFELD